MKKLKLQRASGSALTMVVFLLLIGGGAAAGWWYWKQRNQESVVYTTVEIRRADLVQAVTATGTLNPVVNVQVGSQISGRIEKLHVDFNSPVKEGQVVAQIDPATYEAAVRQASGELANAKAALELARLNEERARELHNRKAAPKSSLDSAVAALRQAEAQVLIREGSLQRAQVDLERCTILSPVDGIVISRDVDVGQTVAASLSAPIIFTIANDLTKMQINSNVAEADVGNVREGQRVEFTVDAYPTDTFYGTVTQVRNSPLTLDNVVTYDTIIEVNNDALKLKPGMTASTSIITARQKDALLISGAALRFRMPEDLAAEIEAAKETSELPAPEPEEERTPTATPENRGNRNTANAAEIAAQLQSGQGRQESASQGQRRGGRSGGGRGRGGRRSQSATGVPQERTVYILRDGKALPVKIRTGITDGIYTTVESGLSEGDLVITSATKVKGKVNQSRPGSSPNPFSGAGMRRRF